MEKMEREGYDVLVVDDNPGDRRFITESLENSQLDLTVHTVNTSDEALDLFRDESDSKEAHQPDVLLLDWNLSRETSEELVNIAKSGESPVLVMVMTGANPERIKQESAILQADVYFQKPTEPEGYIDRLHSLLSAQ